MTALFPNATTVRQFAKFVVVGCVNVAISFAGFILFYRVFPFASLILDAIGGVGVQISSALARVGVHSVDAGVANMLGAAAGMINSFVFNKHWTFEASGMTHLQVRRFVILNILVIGAGSLVIFVFIDLLHAPYLIIWVITTGLEMVANFLGNKYWTFAETTRFEVADRASADGSA